MLDIKHSHIAEAEGEDNQMTKKKIRLIVTTIVALMTLTIMCTAVSSAASKKTYRLPVKIKTQDSEVMKITYKGNIVKYSFPGNGLQKFTYKGKNKYVVNSLRYTVPFYRQIDNLIHIGDEDNLFKVYESKRGTRYN